jgi:membrane-associated phospholipid phosphatase
MTYFLIGSILFVTGMLYLFRFIDTNEKMICKFIQTQFNREPWIQYFQEIWFLGRTAFAFTVITLLVLYDWKRGLTAGSVFLLTIGVEQIIKLTFKRSRPFLDNEFIEMLQPKEPTDTSFPSGDSLRVWYLAMILSTITGANIYLVIGLITIAVLVSIGRVILGVHHLTDVLAGAGLGITGAGITVWLWQIIGLT